VSHNVEFSSEALADLLDLYDYIALRAAWLLFPSAASGARTYAPACGPLVSNVAL